MCESMSEVVQKPAPRIFQRVKQWCADTEGAVTVDWVVLTATLAVIGGIVVSMTVDGTTDVGNQIGTVLAEKPVN